MFFCAVVYRSTNLLVSFQRSSTLVVYNSTRAWSLSVHIKPQFHCGKRSSPHPPSKHLYRSSVGTWNWSHHLRSSQLLWNQHRTVSAQIWSNSRPRNLICSALIETSIVNCCQQTPRLSKQTSVKRRADVDQELECHPGVDTNQNAVDRLKHGARQARVQHQRTPHTTPLLNVLGP